MSSHLFAHFSRREAEFMQAVLYQEIELQSWHFIEFSGILGEEVLVGLQ